MTRCINIDWLECYVLEDRLTYPHDADYFVSRGWSVQQREYGTPMYEQMFTLYDTFGEPFIEVRRKPKSINTQRGMFDEMSCHLRLVNRACYAQQAALMMAEFIAQNGFTFQRITRVDLCLDFEYFDFGDDPAKFLERYMKGRYAKINQANIAAHGLDQWDGRLWNSVSWGSPKSMVKTRFYNKSMELKQGKDKPYIRQAWQAAGLVDDFVSMTKQRRDGTVYTPVIWRVEFAIKSGTKGWFVCEDYNTGERKMRSYKNTLDVYATRKQMFDVFLSLVSHYFHFKYFEYKQKRTSATSFALDAVKLDPLHKLSGSDNREPQRKDRCQDKPLFRTDKQDTFYSVEKTMSANPHNIKLDRLLRALYEYRITQYNQDVLQACNTLIRKLEQDARIGEFTSPMTKQEVEILRHLLSARFKQTDTPFEQDLADARNIVQQSENLFKYDY